MSKNSSRLHEGPVIDQKNGFKVIDCRNCCFKHILPLPSTEDVEEIYREEYYSKEKPLYLERYTEDLEWWNLVYSDCYDTYESLLQEGRRKLIDIGSGPGYFLLYGQQRAWEVLGIEPSKQASDFSRKMGVQVLDEFLTPDVVDRIGRFDVVHMKEVLEHVPDPHGMIEMSRDLLLPGGLLSVSVPNDYNPFQEALRKNEDYPPWWIAPPHHLNYFDLPSLEQLLRRYGFEIVFREGTFPMELFLLMGDNYIGDDPLGRKCHGKRKRLEQTLSDCGLNHLKRQVYQTLAEMGIGREIHVIGRKLEATS